MNKSDKTGKSQRLIEQNLKDVYNETLNEELPDRFHVLLDRLRAQSAKPDEHHPPKTETED